jgi:acetylornithine/N-succinyldiaminopimelate aminotransferase
MQLAEIQSLDQNHYMSTYGSRTPVAFTHGEGMRLYATDGKAYTDFLAGIAVNALGYRHPKLTRAICDQASKLIHCSNLYYMENQAALAKTLTEISCADKVFFANSGAEANEGAFKLARKYFYLKGEARYEVISAYDSFHGRTLCTVAATGQEKYQKPFAPMPQGFIQVPYNDLAAVERAVTGKTCAVLVEVIQCEGGVIIGTEEYIRGLRKLCDAHGILLIIDEVQTGIGRTGTWFGCQQYGIEPDIFTSAKALGGGVPLGAVLAKGEVAEAFEPGNHASTFGGNPLACAAGLAVISAIKEEGLLENAKTTGQYLLNRLRELGEKHSFIVDVRGRGLMAGMQLDPAVPGQGIVATMLEMGYLINCAGHNTLRFAPPLIASPADVDGLIDALSKVLGAV